MAKSDSDKQPDQQPRSIKVKMVAPSVPADEIYVDGVAGCMGRAGVIKLDCYRVLGFDKENENAEVRCITHRLVLPAMALSELVNTIKGLAENSAQSPDKPAEGGDKPN